MPKQVVACTQVEQVAGLAVVQVNQRVVAKEHSLLLVLAWVLPDFS